MALGVAGQPTNTAVFMSTGETITIRISSGGVTMSGIMISFRNSINYSLREIQEGGASVDRTPAFHS